MSDAIEQSAAGATRVLFGSISFILLMVGIEGATGAVELAHGLSPFLIAFGVISAYAAVFWESAKRAFSIEAQEAIGRFAQSRLTWFGLIFLFLQTIILSPFIERQRWPFSYPAEPAIYAEKSRLEKALNQANTAVGIEKEPADKWRFVTILRSLQKECRYHADVSRKSVSIARFWDELLRAGGWIGISGGAQDGLLMPAGITIRIPGTDSQCAGTLQRALADIYPDPPSKIATNQQTAFLSSCSVQSEQECVQIDVNY